MAFLIVSALFAEKPSEKKVKEVSKYIGYTLSKDMEEAPGYYDKEALIEGIRAYSKGESVHIDEQEAQRLFLEAMDEISEKQAKENLDKAECFLEHIAQKEAVIEVQKQRLYYKVKKEGDKTKPLKKEGAVTVHCMIQTLDGMVVLDTWKDEKPLELDFSDVIEGVSLGLEGASIGERRVLYIHPDLAYKKSATLVPPESLLIVDVETQAVTP